jgi:uncharacterized protein
MILRLIRYADAAVFGARVEPLLVDHEAENCLALGLCSTLIRNPSLYRDVYMAVIEDNGIVVSMALRTAPFNLVLAYGMPQEAQALVAEDTFTLYPDLPGIHADAETGVSFVSIWHAATNQAYRVAMAERVYKLESVQPVRAVSGAIRRITEADRQLVRSWLEAFSNESSALPERDFDPVIDESLRFDTRGHYLWVDDEKPVSLAGYNGPTPHGIRVGPVYTPPELRGRGYATACVAQLSQILLDEGRQFVFLFTDLSNPTSNHIYQEIGYRPICDINLYAFGA